MERKELPTKEGVYLLCDFSSLEGTVKSKDLIGIVAQMEIPVFLIDNSSREYFQEGVVIRTLNNEVEMFHNYERLSLVREIYAQIKEKSSK